MSTMQEPLQESAPLARELAKYKCSTAPAGGCGWNHGLWQYLRRFGLITTPEHQREWFARAITPLPLPARILISGAADYGMLAQVVSVAGVAAARPDITVVDCCGTPLELCEWYAQRSGIRIATHRSDILDFEDAGGFDLICTHSFLGQFDPGSRRRLARKWFDLLRRGGRVVTVNRVRPQHGGGWVGFTAEQASRFEQTVALRAREVLAGEELSEVLVLATRYARRFGAWAVGSADEIRELFECAGLRIEALSQESVHGAGAAGVSGPSTPGGAEYVCIIAVRPH